ncbi:hypothetical protein K461DRAFT_276045 [Myriangium duriaei CBS 260.36]|uniref:Uncharacterized protein n=1 Tax=Myriangium duriaei CBS 260.36 TaxID=1168546 RepID=A0A9P4MJ28_9PEZI|nr:hypothetical protein K461DRAFT_276045 [Myriangium duriaei CBS 260.36]
MDSHQGGDLYDMAKDGTSIPGDAGKQNLIPSKPRPDQIGSDDGATDLAGAATNAADIPRGHRDMGATGEVLTGTGDVLDATVESKRLHYGANDPLSKGHDRYDKHSKQKGSDLDRYAKEGAEIDGVPGDDTIGGTKGRDERRM